MRHKTRTRTVGIAVLAAGLAVTAVAATLIAAPADAARRQVVVATSRNASLGRMILVNRRGMTLYDLSVERHGKFICKTSMCLSLWKPLVVARGTKPAGARSLATVKRPDGRLQVTYRGAPLYTFTGDHKRGDVKGNGFRDVGVWHPAFVSGHATGSASGSNSGGGGYPGY